MNLKSMAAGVSGFSVQSEIIEDHYFCVIEQTLKLGLPVEDAGAFKVVDHPCATNAKCARKQRLQEECKLDGSDETCPWHRSRANAGSGSLLQLPTDSPIKAYRAFTEGDNGRAEPV